MLIQFRNDFLALNLLPVCLESIVTHISRVYSPKMKNRYSIWKYKIYYLLTYSLLLLMENYFWNGQLHY